MGQQLFRAFAVALLLGLSLLSPARAEMTFTERELANGPLRGTLTLPSQGEVTAAALVLSGSGPVDRDGNLPHARNDSLKALARGLAAHGIATLRVDKRGIGASGVTREEDLRFTTYVTDAQSWLAILKAWQWPAGHAPPLFLIGHSEGALVATLAAQGTSVTGLVLIAGAGEPAGALLERQLAAAELPQALRAQSHRILESLLRQSPVADVPPELFALYRPSVQGYLMSWLPLDPAAELAKVSAPVLVVQGTTDLQVSPEDADRLTAARPGARQTRIEGMNHVLKLAPPDRGANLATYAMPDLPLAPGLIPAIVTFMGAP